MNNEKGFTLVEILASLAILFIILITFFGFFTQSAIFTKTNERPLNATNLANHVVEVLRSHNVSDVEQLDDTIRGDIGIDNGNQFTEHENFLLKITNLGTEADLELTKVRMELIHVENGSILATRYFFVSG